MRSTTRNRWRAIWQPDMYHGWGRWRSFFEGWYFKLVDADERFVLALIPGIAYDKMGRAEAFLQVLDGKAGQAQYHVFPANAFEPANDKFAVKLADNFFSADRIQLQLPDLKGEIHFKDCYTWPRMLGAPGIMGWYSFVPFMECYHGIVSLHHTLQGSLHIGAEKVDFSGGKGYIEKDWGVSFPHSWIWMQTNHFETMPKACLTASVARIPWLGRHFVGYIVGLLLGDRLYRFATYTGAMMKADFDDQTVRLAFKGRNNRLEIIAQQAYGGTLLSPISGNMTGKVNESMQASIQVQLFENERLIFSDIGRNAGLEVAGPARELCTNNWRR